MEKLKCCICGKYLAKHDIHITEGYIGSKEIAGEHRIWMCNKCYKKVQPKYEWFWHSVNDIMMEEQGMFVD